MASLTRKIIYIENVGKLTAKQLARYLTFYTEHPWQHVEVAFLYSKLQSSHHICAVVRVPNLFYDACQELDGSTVFGQTIRMLDKREYKSKIRLARWIELANGSRISAKGTKHWAIDLYMGPDNENNNGEEAGRRGFYDWSKINLQGGADFCYAAVDCGTNIQEKPDPRLRSRWDLSMLIERIITSGVQKLVLKGSSIRKAERAKALAASYPQIMGYSVGFHPDLTRAWKADKLKTLQTLASDPACVAIGECGLDSQNTEVAFEDQVKLLKLQVELACQLQKPLLVYEREAQQSLLDVLKDFHGRLPFVAVRTVTYKCDFSLYIKHGHYIVITGKKFRGKTYGTPFFKWLRRAKPWQLDYLLLATGTSAKDEYPSFLESVESEFERVTQNIPRSHYSKRAMGWCMQSYIQLSRTTPLCLPVLIELVADRLKLSPTDVANKCLQNSKRFFENVDQMRPKKPKMTDWGWGLMKFLVPLGTSLLCSGILFTSVTSLHD